MTEFKHLLAKNLSAENVLITIASGPVIIKDNKVLLDKHSDDFWKFPGGAVHSDNGFEENAIREAKEELNIDVRIIDQKPLVISFVREREGKEEFVILIHYLAEIVSGEPKPDRGVTVFEWRDIDNLPSDRAPNIRPAVEYFRDRG